MRVTGAGGYTALGTDDTEGDNWLDAEDDDEWERNWNAQVTSGTAAGGAGSAALAEIKPQPVAASNPNDFESYNPLSKVAAKPKSADDDLWDMLNN